MAHDGDGNELKVGDTLYASLCNKVCRVRLVRIAPLSSHRGCGYWTHKLTVEPIDGGRKLTINDPRTTIRYQ
jgi:hypothetical protein